MAQIWWDLQGKPITHSIVNGLIEALSYIHCTAFHPTCKVQDTNKIQSCSGTEELLFLSAPITIKSITGESFRIFPRIADKMAIAWLLLILAYGIEHVQHWATHTLSSHSISKVRGEIRTSITMIILSSVPLTPLSFRGSPFFSLASFLLSFLLVCLHNFSFFPFSLACVWCTFESMYVCMYVGIYVWCVCLYVGTHACRVLW